MRRGDFPLGALPEWCLLNGVAFTNVSVANTDGRGLGLVAEKDLPTDSEAAPPLLKIPRDLVLSPNGIEQYAKQSREFRELLDAAGHQSTRGDALLFLLYQMILSSPDNPNTPGARNPWTQYFSLLPTQVPVPTLWSEPERALLRGTSLESAVSAKLDSLILEFNRVGEKTSHIPFWQELVEIDNVVTLDDWILLDALYRSRSLALPIDGESMVPCLDLVNHSRSPTAYFEQSANDEVHLLLCQGSQVPAQGEITINYGHDKPAAEMLFSYGFIDPSSTVNTIVLPVDLMQDDPLSKAKLHVFGKPPTLKLTAKGNEKPAWSASYVSLMCLNQEDGLDFKILQETDGSQHLRMFWQDNDVTEKADEMEKIIEGHELCQVFRLRVISVISEAIQQQVDKLETSQEGAAASGPVRPEVLEAASQLRVAEDDLFQQVLHMLEEEKSQLFEDGSVLAYLRSMEDSNEDDIESEDYS